MKTIVGLDGRERAVEKLGKYIIHFTWSDEHIERVVYEAVDGHYIRYGGDWRRVFPVMYRDHISYYRCPTVGYYITT